jgi:hypothetical protein
VCVFEREKEVGEEIKHLLKFYSCCFNFRAEDFSDEDSIFVLGASKPEFVNG